MTEEVDPNSQYFDDYQSGGYSPRLLQPAELEADTLVYDPSDDMKRLEFARNQVLRTGQAKVMQHLDRYRNSHVF